MREIYAHCGRLGVTWERGAESCACISDQRRYIRNVLPQGCGRRPDKKPRNVFERPLGRQQGRADMLQVHDPLVTGQAADRLDYARQIIRGEAAALEQVAQRLDDSFLRAIDLFHDCPGRVGITWTGKSADVGQKIAGTFNSTGTRAYVLDATRAMHGDLGMVHPNDVILVLSHSGESDEVVRLLQPLKHLAHAVVAVTGNARSTLARQADLALILGPLQAAC